MAHGGRSPAWRSSLVPHQSATTAAGTRRGGPVALRGDDPGDRSSRRSRTPQRRGGYARTPSPFIDGLATGEPEPAPPPPRHRRARVDPMLARLTDWREQWARQLDVLPTELCTDRDLAAIARHRPTTADELADVTSFGPMTAERIVEQLARARGRTGRPLRPESDSSQVEVDDDRSVVARRLALARVAVDDTPRRPGRRPRREHMSRSIRRPRPWWKSPAR